MIFDIINHTVILNASHTRRATMVHAHAYADAGADLLLLLTRLLLLLHMLTPMPMHVLFWERLGLLILHVFRVLWS